MTFLDFLYFWRGAASLHYLDIFQDLLLNYYYYIQVNKIIIPHKKNKSIFVYILINIWEVRSKIRWFVRIFFILLFYSFYLKLLDLEIFIPFYLKVVYGWYDLGVEISSAILPVNLGTEKFEVEVELIITYNKQLLNNVTQNNLYKYVYFKPGYDVQIVKGYYAGHVGLVEIKQGYILINKKEIPVNVYLLINEQMYEYLKTKGFITKYGRLLTKRYNTLQIIGHFDVTTLFGLSSTKWINLQDAIDTYNHCKNTNVHNGKWYSTYITFWDLADEHKIKDRGMVWDLKTFYKPENPLPDLSQENLPKLKKKKPSISTDSTNMFKFLKPKNMTALKDK